jgi:ribose transport system substrate-binding protein
MKKFANLCILMVMLLVAATTVFAAGEKDTGSKAPKELLVGYCAPSTVEPFLANLTNEVQRLFAAEGIKVQIASAQGDAATQISQIENFVAMGANLIILMPVDPTSVGDAIRRAQAKGTKVMVSGADPGVYDAITWIDQFQNGSMMAEMAAEWIEKTFPSAAPGSVEIAIIEAKDTPPATDRSNGMKTITKLTNKVKVVAVQGDAKTEAAGVAVAENILQANPNVKMFLCYNSGGALGVNEFAMRPGSPIANKAQFAVFTSDVDPQSLKALRDSRDGKSVLRGIVQFGGASLPKRMHEVARMVLLGLTTEKRFTHTLTKVTLANADQF